VPPLHAGDIANSSPLLWLQAVRNKEGRIVSDLGSRQINSRDANGYRMTFDNVPSFHDFGAVDVWIDPQTDLPVEFCFQHAKNTEGVVNRFSVTDIQWNIDLDPKLFDTTPPAGFLDVTLPQDDRSIAEIVAALKLYAELSGGKYPHVEKLDDRAYTTKFDAAACHRDMFRLAGFVGPPRDEWADDPTYQRILQSRAALDTLERVFHNPNWLIGYDGSEVAASDNNKLLLWWNIARENAKSEYRLFYGDLRTEVVPRKKWVKFVPPEIEGMTE
jgi:hypothetical protein